MPKAKPSAKPLKATTAELREVVITYDLFELPTAFHKAGLAGLVMLLDWLIERGKLTADGATYTVTAKSLQITFTEPMIQKLMDEVYDAATVEVAVKAKWAGAELKREDLVEEQHGDKVTKTKRFIYDVVQPNGAYLRDRFPDGDGLWLKLWRDMLWSIPRGRPTTREPYNQRARKESCKEGQIVWADLLKVHKARGQNEFHTAEVSSALLPGAQAVNAEGVPFQGRAEQNLLLHFWPLAVVLFVPQAIEIDGTSDFVGFSLAVPEVSDLKQFVADYPLLLQSRSAAARGYRPAQAVVDLAAEGALSFLDSLAVLTGLQIEAGELRFSISGVDYVHLTKVGNNVKTVAAGRVSPNQRLLSGYRQIVAPHDESRRYRNPLFRRGLLLSLLDDEPWYRPFGRTFSLFDSDLFLRQPHRTDDGEPKGPPSFANDVAKKLRDVTNLYLKSLERSQSMPNTERPTSPPAVIINRVVRSYLLARTTGKTEIDPKTFQTLDGDVDYKAIPAEFNDEKQKLAQSLFLEFRSRKDQAFVDHFAATFFSGTQRLSEADRLELADMLTNADRRDDLKTLTLLSLSANS